MILQSFVLTPRLFKQIAIALVLIALLGMGLHFIFTNGRVVITAAGQGSSPITITITGTKHTKAKVIKLSQSDQRTLWLPNDDYAIVLTQDHRQTIGATRVHAFAKTEVNLNARDEAASTKLTAQSYGCGTISAGVYYSFDCLEPSKIYRHASAGTSPIIDKIFNFIVPFDSGLIVNARGEEGIPLAYIDPATARLSSIALPNTLSQFDAEDFQVIVNSTSTATYKFAIVSNSSNTWFLYRNTADQSPLQVSPGKVDDNLIALNYQLMGDLLATFAGPKPEEEDEAVTVQSNNQKTAAASKILTYSVTTRQTNMLSLPANISLDSAYLTSPDTALAEVSNGGLAILKSDGNNLKHTGTIPDGRHPAIRDARVIFSRGSSVYQYHPDTKISNRLYEAESFSISSLNLVGNTILMQTFTGQESQGIIGKPTAFALDLTKPATYPRPEWALGGGDQSSGQSTSYEGLKAITEYGVSTFQVDGLKYALGVYYKSLNKNLDTVTIDESTVTKKSLPRGSSERVEVSFTVHINKNDTYQARLQYFDVSAIRLYLSKPSNPAVVYDSQDIDISQ